MIEKRTVWTIDVDHNADLNAPEASCSNARYICGPRGVGEYFVAYWATEGNFDPYCDSKTLSKAISAHPEAIKFRLYDDDDYLLYEGHLLQGDECEALLRPLDDFGTPNAGATYIKILQHGKWDFV